MTTFGQKSSQATETEQKMRDELKLKRVYETPRKDDGARILVDRLWPRGLTKEKAKVDLWLKEIAPSTELRKWFGHDPKKWKEFRGRYQRELKQHPDELEQIRGRREKEESLSFTARAIRNTTRRLSYRSFSKGSKLKLQPPQPAV